MTLLLYLVSFLYTVAIFSVLAAYYFSSLNDFLRYGKTRSISNKQRTVAQIPLIGAVLDRLLGLKVPKSWFTHFYIVSTLMASENIRTSQCRLVTGLFLFQSARRLLECIYVSKFSSVSKMNLSHYLVGFTHYIGYNLIVRSARPSSASRSVVWLSLVIFAVSSIDQLRNHEHLASLVKYTQPDKGLFRLVSSAHYFDEMCIYFALALLIPDHMGWLAFCWVTINLSIAGIQTHDYYESKFGKCSKWKAIPFLL